MTAPPSGVVDARLVRFLAAVAVVLILAPAVATVLVPPDPFSWLAATAPLVVLGVVLAYLFASRAEA